MTMRGWGFYVFLLVSAGLLNLAGYLFSLWQEKIPFDELVHLYTTLAVVAAIGFALIRNGTKTEPRLPTFLAAGVLLGLAWEGFELLVGMIGSVRDTIVDLIMDVVGASLGFALVRHAFARRTSGASD